MKIKALTGFCGRISMFGGEIREVEDEIAKDLIRAGHAEPVEETKEKTKKSSKKSK